MCWYRALFQIGVQIGKQADDSVFGVGCWGDGGVVVWVSTLPLGRPVALTLGPPLNLPLGRERGMARGRGDTLLWDRGVAVMRGVVVKTVPRPLAARLPSP